MIDITHETLLSIPAAATWLKRRGMRGSRESLFRWVRTGLLAGNGETVLLEAVRLGSRQLRTSVEALQRFTQRFADVDLELRARAEQVAETHDVRRQPRRAADVKAVYDGLRAMGVKV